MVSHQHVSVQRAPRFRKCYTQPVQVTAVVVLGKEARLAIVAALHDVQWNTIEMDTGSAGHGVGRVIVVYPFNALR